MSMTKKDLKMKRLELEETQARIIKDYILSGHSRPRTRRDFMSSGLSLFGGMLFMPTLAQLISSSAWAAECGDVASTASAFPAYINIQLSGGPALFANTLVRGSGGALLDYTKLGMGANPRMETLFANNAPFWIEPDAALPASGMVRGLFSAIPKTGATDSDIYTKAAFIAVAAESVDDRSSNPNDISGMLAAAGIVGSSLPHLLTGYGRILSEDLAIPSANGVGAIIASSNMLKVETAAGLEGSMSFKGALGALPSGLPQRLIAAIENLSKKQVEALGNASESHESQKILKELVNCATEKNTKVLSTSNIADIYSTSFPNAAAVAAIWAKNKSAADTNSELTGKGLDIAKLNTIIERCGLAAANCIRGYSGAASINLGGYDYHSSQYNRQSADLKDKLYGDVIGRILRTAKAFNRKVFIHVSSDGSLNNSASSSATVNWSGDFPKRGMSFIIAYDPAGAPTTAGFSSGGYADTPFQLNHFTSDAVVANVNPIGSLDAQDLCAAAIFLNYLSFAKRTDLIDTSALAPVKNRLASALPSGSGSIFNYYTRIKAS